MEDIRVARQVIERNLLLALKEDRSKSAASLLSELDSLLRNNGMGDITVAKTKRFPEGVEVRLLELLAAKSVGWRAHASLKMLLGFGIDLDLVSSLVPEGRQSWFAKFMKSQSAPD